MTEIGVAFQTDKPPGRYGALAAAAEGYGFDVVSVFADLLYQPPLPALLEMARATSRVRLGAACLNPYTQHPYEIAGGLADRKQPPTAGQQPAPLGSLVARAAGDLRKLRWVV